MLYYYRSWWCGYSRPFRRFFYIFILSLLIALVWSILTTVLFGRDDDVEGEQPPLIFCFVLSANNRHLTSSRAIVYTWGKRCDRFYFVTRLQNTSVELMMLEKFENITDITSDTITQYTLDVLLYLRNDYLFSSYHWFLRASDESYVIIPNLRRLLRELNRKENNRPFAYIGDVKQMYDKYQISTTGSVMLFNRKALDRLAIIDSGDDENELNIEEKQTCLEKMIYDHEFVTCIKQIGININPVNDNLIFSQNLSIYKMDKRLKGSCCSPNTVAFRSINETDMYKFDFLYHRLDAVSKINPY